MNNHRRIPTRIVTCHHCTQQSEIPVIEQRGLWGCWQCQTVFEISAAGVISELKSAVPTPIMEKMRTLLAKTNAAIGKRDGIVPFEEMDRITSAISAELGMESAAAERLMNGDDCLHCIVHGIVVARAKMAGIEQYKWLDEIDALSQVLGELVANGIVLGGLNRDDVYKHATTSVAKSLAVGIKKAQAFQATDKKGGSDG